MTNGSTVPETKPLFQDKMPTGIPGLDYLLDGGVVRANSLLIEGPPGSGKSTLGLQILYRGAELHQEPCVMVAFEEFPRQLYSEYATYGFDLEALEAKGLLRIIWTDPRKVVAGFTGKDDLVGRIVDEMGAKRLMIDSITHFKRVAPSEVDLREILYRVLNNLKLKGVNSILIKELERDEGGTIAFEEYVVDGSIRIINRENPGFGEVRRAVQIRKTRGQKHIPGVHPFEFEEKGIEVYPHLTPRHTEALLGTKGTPPTRKSTGIPTLDDLIEGGYRSGSQTMIVGYPGTGKTTLARHFLHTQLQSGEKCLHLSFQEDKQTFFDCGRTLGLDFRQFFENEALHYHNWSPVGLIPEKFMGDLFEHLVEGNFGVVVLDSLSDLKAMIQNDVKIREGIYFIMDLFRRMGITSLILNESNEMCGLIPTSEMESAHLADSVIQLSLAEIDGRVHHFIGVTKMTQTAHSKSLHEFEVTSSGLRIKAQATGLSGILSGNTGGQLQSLAEEVLQPLEQSTQSLVQLSSSADLDATAKKSVLNVLEQLGAVDILLREHFGMTDFAGLVAELGEIE